MYLGAQFLRGSVWRAKAESAATCLTRKDRDAYFAEVFKCGIVQFPGTGRVRFVSGGDEDHHALAGTGEKDTIRVPQILSAIGLVDCLPS